MIYGLIQYSIHRKSSKKKKSLAAYLAESPHIYMQKEIFFHESHDLFAFPFCEEKKNQRLQGLLYCIMLNSKQLFIESFQGQQQGLYA